MNKSELSFSVEEVEKAVLALNNSSALDSDGVNVWLLNYAHPAIYMLLRTLYNKIIQLGMVPYKFCRGIILPVVKNASNSLNDLFNYRPVSIIFIIAKTFESLVSLKFGHLFTTHVNQFGFSTNGGCSKAIFAPNSTVQYFREKNSNVYLCALDMSKAFDRLNHFSIFQCLIHLSTNPALSITRTNRQLRFYYGKHACLAVAMFSGEARTRNLPFIV